MTRKTGRTKEGNRGTIVQKISFEDLINVEQLQRLQNEFCSATGIVAYCLDGNKEQITQISGAENADEIVQQYAAAGYVHNVLDRVEEGSLEDLATEESEVTGGKVAAVAVRFENHTVLYWIVLQVGGADDLRFEHVLDLLRDASYSFLENKVICYSAEAESRRSLYAQQEMTRDLHIIEATAEFVQLLDSDEQMEAVMERALGILGEHLGADTAQIFQLRSDNQVMDVLGEWYAQGMVPYFDMTNGIEAPSFLRTVKPLVLSAGASAGEYESELAGIGLKAVMIFPIFHQDTANRMILSVNCRSGRPNWGPQEIKFVSDAVKVLQSILTRRIQKNSIASSHAALEKILDNMACAVYVEDKSTGEMLFANRRLRIEFVFELQDGSFKDLLEESMGEEKTEGFFEVYQAEREHWYDLFGKEITWVDGRRAVLYSMYDITDKKLYQKKIEQQAYTDFLTGLYNRICCERDLARLVDEAKRDGGTGAILYLDLDDFKHINEALGHQYGDILLKAVSHALKNIEGIRDTCYRMGGDEFVILVPPQYYYKFQQILEDIKKIFSKPWLLKDADYYCTMSMGIVTFPDSGDSVQDLVKKADIAMYEAKNSGKDRTVIYKDGIDSISGRRLDMEKNMRDATAAGYKEFEVYYQPVIDITRGTDCIGAEALIRWNSGKLGFIPPAEFIPLAEYLGLINPIGNYVLQEACACCKEWNDGGYPDYRVSVNLSVVQLLQTDIVEVVEKALKKSGMTPANLTLEVTESLAINDMERMKDILGRIKALGVKIALDDFGTGYSSLNHIREIPFDIIKIDQSFVKDLADDAYSQAFIKMVAELAETIGVSICVEGIETPEQYKVLQGMNIKYIQGYYFDRPMRRQEFEEKYIDCVDFL